MTAPRAPRVLIYDLETAPILGYAWGKYDQNLIGIKQDWFILSCAYKWLGEKKVHSLSLPDYPGYCRRKADDSKLVKDIWKLFDQADIVIAHNGNRFDQPKARARFVVNGLKPPSPFREVDTLKVARRFFKFTSNSLDDLCRQLGIGRKLTNSGFRGTWEAAMAGNPKAWDQLNRYNRQDVVLLEKLYLRLLPWMEGHPNMAMISDKPNVCPKCGNGERPLKSKGWRYYGVTKRRVFRCLKNGCVVYGRVTEKSSVTHVS